MKKTNKFKETELGMMPEDWELKRIDVCCNLVKKQYKPNGGENKKYIGLEHIEQGTLRLSGTGNSSDVISNKFIFEKGQILFGKLRPYFRKVFRPYFDGVCSTDFWVIDSKKGFENNFLFYFFADERIINEATNSSEGTKMPRAKWDYISKLEFAFPPFPEQTTIAKILSDLDAKIELNQEMNKTLEAIGQTIFKHWFIGFEFPNEDGKPYKSAGGEMVDSELGMIPKGWDSGKLGDHLQTILGGTPSTQEKEYWTNGKINWINSGKVNEFRIIEPTIKITQKALDSSATKIMPKGTTVLAITGATLGQVSRIEIDTCANQSVIGIIESNNIPSEFIYFWIKYKITELISHQTGGAQQHINKNNVNDLLLMIPNGKEILKFKNIIKPIFTEISNNCFESLSLSQIRDALLPRLMSGKIRVGVA